MPEYPEFHADLQKIHESEVYGAAVFENAARVTFSRTRKNKWRRLAELEHQTLSRYLDFMKQTGQPISDPWYWRLKGHLDGLALGLLPWPIAMRTLRNGTQPFQKRFLRLKQHAGDTDRAFFDYIYAHEKAIEAFASMELAKERDNSLKPVESLLG